MMEIDLPRMRSLSPRVDSPPPINTMPAMTNVNQLNLTDVIDQSTEIEQTTLNTPPMNTSKANEWKFESDACGCKMVCGCKYINKVSRTVSVYLTTYAYGVLVFARPIS